MICSQKLKQASELWKVYCRRSQVVGVLCEWKSLVVNSFLLLQLSHLTIWLSIVFVSYLYSFALISSYHDSKMPNDHCETIVSFCRKLNLLRIDI